MNIKRQSMPVLVIGMLMSMATLVSVLASCSKKQTPTPPPTTVSLDTKITGQWQVQKIVDYGGDTPYTMVLTDCQKAAIWSFLGDNAHTFTITKGCTADSFTGTYKIENKALAIWNADQSHLEVEGPITFSDSDNTLVIDDNTYGGYVYTMARVK